MDESRPNWADLNRHLDEIAQTPLLLVASDFDGTLAPIVSDPNMAEANRESLVALRALEAMPQTHVSIISGRSLRDLAVRMGQPEEAHLIGSHGSEFEAGFALPLPPGADELLSRVKADLHEISLDTPGSLVEEKPAGLAFHYRNAEEAAAQTALERVALGPARANGVHVRHGKKVIELSVVETNKGQALEQIRQRLGARAVLFLGDDTTDEDAFATLGGPDVGIKVGDGPTRAKYRIRDTVEAAQVLARLAEKRAAWLAGAQAVPIDSHAILSDQRTAAIVSPTGRITWLCMPRFDSSSLFAELLGGPAAGFFEIRPASDGDEARQQYLGDSFVLQTEWPGLTVTDYLDCSEGRAFQRAGRTDLVRVVEGTGRVRLTFAPRLDFGRMETRLKVTDGGLQIEGALDPCVLFAPGITWQLSEEGRHQVAVAEVEMTGQALALELRYGTGNLTPGLAAEAVRRQQTERFWSGWAATLKLPDLYPSLVRRSALVLKALCYGPTGAITAAATTSLPECIGGVRNWDYRFCWPRDAAMAAAALVRLGSIGLAMKLLDWVLGIIEKCEPPAFICPVYTVTGGHLGTEAEVGELAGYRGSRPVRVGNSAAHQIQLDVLGPIAELLALLARRGAALSSEHWRLLDLMVSAVGHRWRDADHGIWEVRRHRRQHVHSKVMCWQTVDCALQVAAYLGRSRPDWSELRATIADDILANGWNAERKAFCVAYDESDIDAASLAVGLSGLLPPSDERFAATVAAVERELLDGPTVYRYRYDDGLPGIEGGFHLCTTWLIESYAIMGRSKDARKLFDDYVGLVGPMGLLSEEYDPSRRQGLGNFPQAYSHIGLINAACRLARA